MHSRLLHDALVALTGFVSLIVLAVIALILLRIFLSVREEWVRRRQSAIRNELFELFFAEPDAATATERALMSRRGRSWDLIEGQAFSLLPKVRGDAGEKLVELLRDKGALTRAERRTHSLSAVRRCRGAFAVGVLGDARHVPTLIGLLSDRTFLVRRVAVRALGNIGDPQAVDALLHQIGEEPRLSRDLIYALNRIGTPGVPLLREEFARALDQPGERGSHGDLAATVLGLLDDIGSAELLGRGLSSPDPGLVRAAAEALGRIGNPESIPVLIEALHSESDLTRRAATRAMGELGSPLAGEHLLDMVEENDPHASRDAALALRSQGHAGLELLRTSTSPYAVEAVALAALRGER